MNNIIHLSIAKDFSKTPGVRFPSEGNYSGEEFRDKILIPKLKEALENHDKLLIDMDGTSGLGPSFLDESFGGLIRKGYNLDELLKTLRFKSDEVSYYKDDVITYMKEAANEK